MQSIPTQYLAPQNQAPREEGLSITKPLESQHYSILQEFSLFIPPFAIPVEYLSHFTVRKYAKTNSFILNLRHFTPKTPKNLYDQIHLSFKWWVKLDGMMPFEEQSSYLSAGRPVSDDSWKLFLIFFEMESLLKPAEQQHKIFVQPKAIKPMSVDELKKLALEKLGQSTKASNSQLALEFPTFFAQPKPQSDDEEEADPVEIAREIARQKAKKLAKKAAAKKAEEDDEKEVARKIAELMEQKKNVPLATSSKGISKPKKKKITPPTTPQKDVLKHALRSSIKPKTAQEVLEVEVSSSESEEKEEVAQKPVKKTLQIEEEVEVAGEVYEQE